MTTLRRKLTYHTAALLVSLLVLGAAALSGINAMRSDFSAAFAGYSRLRALYIVGSHVEAARTLLNIVPPDPDNAQRELQRALDLFNLYFPTDPAGPNAKVENDIRVNLTKAAKPGISAAPPDASSLNAVLKSVIYLDAANGRMIESAKDRADYKRRWLLYAMSGLLVCVALGALVIGRAQYRSVMWPLVRMKMAVERIASGRFNGRVDTQGTAEFAELASHFNRMAARLEDMYHNLQQKVDAKSRELLRNERLASVGLLAAGVAHEINNPLSIMTAHAELSLQAIERGDEDAADESARTLAVICEEAFRCKRIVEKLLTLGRGPEQPPAIFSLADLVGEVAASVRAMPAYHDRYLIAETDRRGRDLIRGRSDEIKQVVLNLLFNALEATPAGGQVHIAVAGDGREVELSVSDTGRGMPAAVLDQIFEPFFTDARGKTPAAADARRGTGLGLSIAHAIVQRHGGEIRVHSDGPGMGSRFTVTLPAAPLEEEEADA